MTDITIAPDISGSKGKWSPLTILCHRSEASWSILTRDVGREAQDMWSSPRLEPPSPPQLGPSNPAGKGRRSGSSDPVLFWKPLKERIRIFQKALLLIYGPAVGQNNQHHKISTNTGQMIIPIRWWFDDKSYKEMSLFSRFILPKTAFSLIKSRLALGSPGCLVVTMPKWPDTQENGCWLPHNDHLHR